MRKGAAMRIVYLMTSLGMGGAERQAEVLAHRMAARGHTVVLVVLRPPLAEQWPTSLNVVHLQMRKTLQGILLGAWRGIRLLRSLRPDLIHSHTFPANLMARLLRIAVLRTKLISTIHNVYEGGWLRMLAYRLTDFLSAQSTAVSQAAAESAIGKRAVPRRKCLVLSNGIETDAFVPDAVRRVQTRAAMGVDTEFVWLAAGRVAPAKDYPNLLAAFSLVLDALPHARLWIAGEAMPEALERIKNECGSVEEIRWLGLRRDLAALIDAADGFVLSSAWEGMPLVVGEAMVMAKLVVATDVGGVRELMGDTGMVVPAHAPVTLAEAMIAAMRASENDRLAQGVAARQRVLEHFSMDTRADQWEMLYKKVIGLSEPNHK
jgi:glycosyltransferase involved in cell wall biosynthesis